MYPDLLSAERQHLDEVRVQHLEVVLGFLEAADKQIFTLDLFYGAAMSRSYSLIDGSIAAFDSWNPIIAAPVLRMQIDSLVRLSYTTRAPSAQEVADYVLGGGELRKLKAADGQKLTDRCLVELAEPFHPWVPEVYEATSGWVHFSPEHLRAAWRVRDEGSSEAELRLEGTIPLRPEMIGPEPMRQLLAAMAMASQEVIFYAENWEAHKGLPPGKTRPMRRGSQGPA